MAACVQEGTENPQKGMVSFSKISFEAFDSYVPNARIVESSEWPHIFSDSEETLTITNNSTGEEYLLAYSPALLNSEGPNSGNYQLQLPYGEYSFESIVEGRDLELYLPFRLEGTFEVSSANVSVSLEATADYGLVTVKNEFLRSRPQLVLGTPQNMGLRGDYYYFYVNENVEPTLIIYEFFNNTSFEKVLQILAYNHYHFYLKVIENQSGEVNFIELALGPFEYSEEYFEIPGRKVVDGSGNSYPVVQIGNQWWMAEDLRTAQFCNGDSIEVVPKIEFGYYVEPFLEEEIPAAILASLPIHNGGYYSVDAIEDSRNICPCGWHISTDEDWKEMEEYLGVPAGELDQLGNHFDIDTYEAKFRGAAAGAGNKLKLTRYTETPSNNLTLFSASLQNCYCYRELSSEENQLHIPNPEYRYNYSKWWSPSEVENDILIARILADDFEGIGRGTISPSYLYSVRCVKD